MGNYTTPAKVSEMLNGVSINSSTVPTSTTVESWISNAESEIDHRLSRTYTSTLFSSTIHDYDGSRYLLLPNAPLLSISSLQYADSSLGADSVAWSTLTEGRTNDFTVDLAAGEIQFAGDNLPPAGEQRIRVTGYQGYATVPGFVERLATLMSARDYIQSVVQGTAKEEGGSVTVGNISITDPNNFSAQQLQSMEKEINMLLTQNLYGGHVFRNKRLYSMRFNGGY